MSRPDMIVVGLVALAALWVVAAYAPLFNPELIGLAARSLLALFTGGAQ